MGYATVAVLLAALAQDKNEAEQLFRKMEDKLARAKTLQVAVSISIAGNKEGKFAGSLTLAEGNKARLHLKGALADKALDLEMVSDGVRMHVSNPGSKPSDRETPKNLNDIVARALSRVGLFATLMTARQSGPKRAELGVDDLFRASQFKLGKKEKV